MPQRPLSLRPQHRVVNQETEPPSGPPARPELQLCLCQVGVCMGGHTLKGRPCHQLCLPPALPAAPLAVACREFHRRALGVSQPTSPAKANRETPTGQSWPIRTPESSLEPAAHYLIN